MNSKKIKKILKSFKDDKFEPRDIEFFECDCFGTEHLIRAEYSVFEWKPKAFLSMDRDLDIYFETRIADYKDAVYGNPNIIVRFFKRLIWRINRACRILFFGELTLQGSFSPCRKFGPGEDKIEQIFGYETTKNFAKWLDTKADELKRDTEEDYRKAKEEAEKTAGKSGKL